jgi:hypothetical protein
MGYEHFILVSVDDIKSIDDEKSEKLKICYEQLRKNRKNYPVFGQREYGWHMNQNSLIKKLKMLTTQFPDLTFTFSCFVECGGGRYGVFIVIKDNTLITTHEEDFDRQLISIKTEKGAVEIGVLFKCEDTFVKNNITRVFNDEYGFNVY